MIVMKTEKNSFAAIVLSAGKGARMHSAVPKQYLMLEGKPVLYYSLLAFQQSVAQDIILVAGEADIPYCQERIVRQYGFSKVSAIIPGGKERYHSVFHGLVELKKRPSPPEYVMIHDGARPFVDNAIISRCAEAVREYQACVAGMPSKDTVKIADSQLFARETPERKYVWQIQTPQAFSFPLIYQAYQELIEREVQGERYPITDDAMVLETICRQKVRLVEGSYENIKITTRDDLKIAHALYAKK